MPDTRLATLRYQVLDRCFSDRHRYYFINDLINAVNEALIEKCQKPVSRRTIFYDINHMEYNEEWDVTFEEPAIIEGQRYYRYEDPNYSIWRNDLNEQQLEQLKSLMLMLQQFRGLPQFERVQELIKQLEEKYKISLPSPKSIIAFDTNEEAAGIEFLSPLFEAIISKQALQIQYKPYGKNTFSTIVHPYFIKQYNNRWFLFGYTNNDKYEGIINMTFDRIQSILPAKVRFIENTKYNFEEYFDDFIGVTKNNDNIEKIILQVSPTRLPYIISKPLHPSQHNHRADEGIIELNVIPNNELYQLLLSFGPDIEVLGPPEIRHNMKQYAKHMMENYKIKRTCAKSLHK